MIQHSGGPAHAFCADAGTPLEALYELARARGKAILEDPRVHEYREVPEHLLRAGES